jgi:hypothetical protein
VRIAYAMMAGDANIDSLLEDDEPSSDDEVADSKYSHHYGNYKVCKYYLTG